jgi:hypothetical protein
MMFCSSKMMGAMSAMLRFAEVNQVMGPDFEHSNVDSADMIQNDRQKQNSV